LPRQSSESVLVYVRQRQSRAADAKSLALRFEIEPGQVVAAGQTDRPSLNELLAADDEANG
jgi:hypothetical protein